ncbi:MAG TPA: MBL fold metallo-hydrolase [Dehalococcoidia bacterium]|jgi:glyoxylase-like metal-dependent hydrolase (beta-lactamase superfamily II)|nr:MBL fold metallo-hydrolase [Dehalococcoidia bacterium]
MPAKHKLGNLDLALLSDGNFYIDAGATFGIVPRVMWEPFAGKLDSRHRVTLGLNSLLLRSQDKLILLETGVGDKPSGWRRQSSPASSGTLMTELDALGVRPEDIDVVINTHLHADHCGWNTRIVDGVAVPTFPNAEYMIVRDEWEAAMAPNERTRATYIEDNLLPVEQAGRLNLVDGETKVTDEVTIVPTPGHSAGHCSIVLSSGGETGIYIGDIAQIAVQLERTAWVSSFDIMPMVSIETKKRLVEQAIEENQLIIAVHAPFPGLGRMALNEQGHRHWSAVDATG